MWTGYKNSRIHGPKPKAAAPAAAPALASPGAASASGPVAAETPAPAAATTEGDTVVVTLKPGALNPMSFDVITFTAKAGQKVKLTFNNDSTAPLQHNLVMGVIGSKERLIAAANGMMSDMPTWMGKGFIPEGPDVLHHTKLLNPKETETLEFTAPAEKGSYPYLCTFPGHSAIMQGTMIVE